MMWVIEDEIHCEHVGVFEKREDAVAELRRRSELPWNKEPNQAPCMSWETCGRNYELVEFDVSSSGHWRELQR
jgi:hypothetical protein